MGTLRGHSPTEIAGMMPGEPSIEDYPHQVGTMVYRTRFDADAAIERARAIYPDHQFRVHERTA